MFLSKKRQEIIAQKLAFLADYELSYDIYMPDYLWEDFQRFWIEIEYKQAREPYSLQLTMLFRRNTLYIVESECDDFDNTITLFTAESFWRILFCKLYDNVTLIGTKSKVIIFDKFMKANFRQSCHKKPSYHQKTLPSKPNLA